VAETYRQDLINKAVETGIRAQGNAFKAELFEKFLATLSIDEIKEVTVGFEAEVTAKFAGVKVSGTNAPAKDKEVTKDSFASEGEFRAFVATEAVKLSKETGKSLKEATQTLYKKFQ
jgi:hypothetical protein